MSTKKTRCDGLSPAPSLQLSPLANAARVTSALAGIGQTMETAYAHWRVGQPAQASVLCEGVLQVAPLHAPALHLLGLVAHADGRIEEALSLLELACAQADAPADFHSNHAEISRQSGLLDRAERAARRALSLEPDHPAAVANLGIILQEAGQLEASHELLSRTAQEIQGDADAFNNLGNTLQLMGRFKEAERSYLAAIDLDPSHEAARCNLASLQRVWGTFDVAIQTYRQVLEMNPQNIPAYIGLAEAHGTCQRTRLALQELDKLTSFFPSDLQAQRLRVQLLLDSSDLEAAEEALLALPSSAPEPWHDRLLQARLLALRGNAHQALEACRQAREVSQGHPLALTAHAMALARAGEATQACLDLRQLLEQSPACAGAWLALAELAPERLSARDITSMRAALDQGVARGMHWQDVVALQRALGHALLETREEESALAAYQLANASEAIARPFDPARFESWVDRQIATHASLLDSGQGRQPFSPVFVIGMPHAGADLVACMLRGGSCLIEAPFDPVGHLLTSITQEDDRLFDATGPLEGLSDDDHAELARYYLDCVDATSLRVDACPANFLFVGAIARIFPAARFIVCGRDPLENCLACYQRPPWHGPAFPRDLHGLGIYYRQYVRLMRHWKAYLQPSQLLEIDHAVLLDDPARVAQQIAAFCRLPCALPSAGLLARAARHAEALAPLKRCVQPLHPLLAALRGMQADGTHEKRLR
ncbi:FOG: TPR repeat [plant metagenome]|uniref:FOG: TPR repeat n=1 Tax=plant metagenome TaxID=1297885 RepID=A0A484UMK3_9ZZZZ